MLLLQIINDPAQNTNVWCGRGKHLGGFLVEHDSFRPYPTFMVWLSELAVFAVCLCISGKAKIDW